MSFDKKEFDPCCEEHEKHEECCCEEKENKKNPCEEKRCKKDDRCCVCCCDLDGCCNKYPLECRDPFWPAFCHPRWIPCKLLYDCDRD
jgi:hypothetical protein